MSPAANTTVYVVTGGNRGLGLGLVKALLARPSTTVVATVRTDAAAATLQAEADASGKADHSLLHIVQLDFSTAIPADKIMAAFKEATNDTLDRVDVLICNAANTTTPLSAASTTTAEDLRAAFETNTISPLMLFQALWPLMQKTVAPAPKLVMMTSTLGSIGGMEPVPAGAYGPSKAALNWITKALHAEHEEAGLVAVALHPGWVQTQAGEYSARSWGYKPGPPDSVEDSVEGILEVVDHATRDTVSGKFVTFTGQTLAW